MNRIESIIHNVNSGAVALATTAGKAVAGTVGRLVSRVAVAGTVMVAGLMGGAAPDVQAQGVRQAASPQGTAAARASGTPSRSWSKALSNPPPPNPTNADIEVPICLLENGNTGVVANAAELGATLAVFGEVGGIAVAVRNGKLHPREPEFRFAVQKEMDRGDYRCDGERFSRYIVKEFNLPWNRFIPVPDPTQYTTASGQSSLASDIAQFSNAQLCSVHNATQSGASRPDSVGLVITQNTPPKLMATFQEAGLSAGSNYAMNAIEAHQSQNGHPIDVHPVTRNEAGRTAAARELVLGLASVHYSRGLGACPTNATVINSYIPVPSSR
jgi:hypothetical protein